MTSAIMPGGGRMPGFEARARDRILHAATTAFSRRGFHGVTVRDLAQVAHVNVAAINYHFRSKEELYAAVIDRALAQWLAETVEIDDLPADTPLPTVIHLLVSALIAPAIEREDSALLPRLIAWDMLQGNGQGAAKSSPAVTKVIRNRLRPHFQGLLPVSELDLVANWLISQCLLLSPALQQPSSGDAPSFSDLQRLAQRISDLALRGLCGSQVQAASE